MDEELYGPQLVQSGGRVTIPKELRGGMEADHLGKLKLGFKERKCWLDPELPDGELDFLSFVPFGEGKRIQLTEALSDTLDRSPAAYYFRPEQQGVRVIPSDVEERDQALVQVGPGGRITIPAHLRARLDIGKEDILQVEVHDDELRIRTVVCSPDDAAEFTRE